MAETIFGGTFTKGGRTWTYETFPGGNTIGIYYEANLEEATRVANKFGEQFTGNADGKYYVLASGYEKQSNGTWRYSPYPPGTETANGNAGQVLAIGADTGLKQQITGSVTNNNPTDPNQPGTPGTSTPTSPPNQNPKEDSAVLKYPLTMDDLQDRIMFHAHEYKSGGRLTGGNFGDLNPVQYNPVDQRVYLPIQSSITDQNSVGWEPDTMNPIEVEAAKLSREFMTSPLEDLAVTVGKRLGKAYQTLKGESESVRTYLVGQAVGVNNLLSRLEGQVLNPNLELLFQGPQLRPFSFTFKLSPRSADEAIRVKEIIRYFKKNMAVKKGTAIFLKAPNVFKIQYQYGAAGKVHQSLNLIKMCALTNCSVDYTPNGTYMTYSDPEATMVSYSISLSFQELTPIYDTDYETFDYGDKTTVSIPTQNSIGP